MATLSERNRQWAKNAPVLILSIAMDNFNHNGQPNRSAMYDTGAASLSLSLQATALGLSVHQMAGFVPIRPARLLTCRTIDGRWRCWLSVTRPVLTCSMTVSRTPNGPHVPGPR
ncbi:nitroreductase family protein [Methylobacter luteus]|uniref:hypothetical protein n=1 Tax=Methylobacter luteus TaxID=415 RepID=UPI001E3DFAE8|nr:hypothetical protein [Methylobacter luteus]